MDLVGQIRAHTLPKFADDQRMDILLARVLKKARLAGLFPHHFHGHGEHRALIPGEETNSAQTSGVGDGATKVDVNQFPVVIERPPEAIEDLRRPSFKTSAPKLHDSRLLS